jgi:hypothetical protein
MRVVGRLGLAVSKLLGECTMINDENLAKIMVLKVIHLGVDARKHPDLQEKWLRLATLAASKLFNLEDKSETLDRHIFYVLILAELNRTNNPVKFRQEAHRLGNLISKNNRTDPFKLYMKAVDATTNTVNTGNFGDFKVSAREQIVTTDIRFVYENGHEPYCEAYDIVADTLDIPADVLNKYGTFLQRVSLEDIAKAHGVIP